MANTGNYIILYLEQESQDGTSTGLTKNNIPSDPDYVAPTQRLDLCLVIFDTSCPTEVGYTFSSGNLQYELTLPSSVYNNPAIITVRVQPLISGVLTGTPQNFTLASMTRNFFSGTFTGLAAGSYTLRVTYYDGSSGQLGGNCTATSL